MKKTLCLIMALTITAIISMPQNTKALTANYNIPDSAIGINEATYNELANASCSYDACDEIIEQFSGKIIFRAEHHGEMYRVNSNDGSALLTRYLPDGFYKANKKLYYVYNGTRYLIKKKNAYSKIINLINNKNIFTPISNQCHDELYNYTADNEYIGKLVMEVEKDGEVHYVAPLAGSEAPYLMKPLNHFAPQKNKKFYTWTNNHAYHVSAKLMKKIPVI